ncbi:MAG: FliI/YscN family ATPase [Ignavibacteria bacterium]|nr:FliI/YscN family ATPase [Ignavibacteria bacterium]
MNTIETTTTETASSRYLLDFNKESDAFLSRLKNVDLLKVNGRVSQVIGLVIESVGPNCSLGEVCVVKSHDGEDLCYSEVVGFKENRVLSMVLGGTSRISPGSEIVASGKTFSIPVGKSLLGRIIDGLGRPMDKKGPIEGEEMRTIYALPPNPLTRRRITEPIVTGIRSIDMLLTCGRGQRVGIFSASGVGKSVTLGMIARNTNADVNVIALIGERGREVRDFIDGELGEEGLARSVVIIATSDQEALVRLKAAFIATTIAEYFRDQGLNVMFLFDSITRVATAQREVGLAIGEPPTTKGYTPSVFALLPKLLERTGNSDVGSITAMYTVLVEGDDLNEPVADNARAILDGHIVLSRRLASAGHYPAIDVLQSISRIMPSIVSAEQRKAVHRFLDLLATYNEAEDLVNIGAYVKGSNSKIDESLAYIEEMRAFLRQGSHEKIDFKQSLQRLLALMNQTPPKNK